MLKGHGEILTRADRKSGFRDSDFEFATNPHQWDTVGLLARRFLIGPLYNPIRMTSPDPPSQPSDPSTWVDQHADALFRYALLRVRRRDVAEDLIQETLLSALRARDLFSGKSSERTWLVGILRHKIIDHIRASAQARTTADVELGELAVVALFNRRGIWKAELAPWSSDPAELAQKQEFWQVLHDCASKLPPPLSEAFCLREFEALPTDQICKILGISASNLSVRLPRARLLLRGCLERSWFNPPDDKEPDR